MTGNAGNHRALKLHKQFPSQHLSQSMETGGNQLDRYRFLLHRSSTPGGAAGAFSMDEESPLIDGSRRTPAGYGASPRLGGSNVRARGGVKGLLASCAPGCFSDAETRRGATASRGQQPAAGAPDYYAGPPPPAAGGGSVGGGGR